MSLLDLSLPNVDRSLFDTPTGARLGGAGGNGGTSGSGGSLHPPRFLLLYGSLRERSYSQLLTLEAARKDLAAQSLQLSLAYLKQNKAFYPHYLLKDFLKKTFYY